MVAGVTLKSASRAGILASLPSGSNPVAGGGNHPHPFSNSLCCCVRTALSTPASHLNVQVSHLGLLLWQFWFCKSGVRPESLHIWGAPSWCQAADPAAWATFPAAASARELPAGTLLFQLTGNKVKRAPFFQLFFFKSSSFGPYIAHSCSSLLWRVCVVFTSPEKWKELKLCTDGCLTFLLKNFQCLISRV